MNLLFSRDFIILETVASTNEYISNTIDNDFDKNSVVFANYQKNGKGNRGKKWESEAGKNILMSCAFKPYLKLNQQFRLNVFIAVALYDFLDKHFKDLISIKWPNDILINNSKIGGILIENKISQQDILYSIIGIGINVNQVHFHHYNPPATSFCIEGGISYDIAVLREELLNSINNVYIQFLEDYSSLFQKYINVLYRKGQVSEFIIGEKKVSGEIINVTEEGKLIIALQDHSLQLYSSGDLQYIF